MRHGEGRHSYGVGGDEAPAAQLGALVAYCPGGLWPVWV